MAHWNEYLFGGRNGADLIGVETRMTMVLLLLCNSERNALSEVVAGDKAKAFHKTITHERMHRLWWNQLTDTERNVILARMAGESRIQQENKNKDQHHG